MSADPAALLEAAHSIVADQLAQLRALIESAQQRSRQVAGEVRQVARALDEITMQRRFAVERDLAGANALSAREKKLRARHDALDQEHQGLQRVLKQLDQLVRQIDMSSSALAGQSDGEPPDPWMLALRSQVIKGREEERVRLAREVHDGPAQVLANTLMGLEHSRGLLQEQRIERLGLTLDRLCDTARDGLAEVRGFIADLRPGRLEEQGLVATLHDYVRRYRTVYNEQVTFDATPLPRLPSEAEIVLYRVVQEALQNAHKHARNAAVHVTLDVQPSNVVLTIRDEGPGFDPRRVAQRAGRESWGLTSMRERAELIGARFVVASAPGRGTEVTVTLPILT